MPCECGSTTKCMTSRCKCHADGKMCGSSCDCSSECCENRKGSDGGDGGGGAKSSSCKCGPTTKCMTPRCKCHVDGKKCGSSCDCSSECCENRKCIAAVPAGTRHAAVVEFDGDEIDAEGLRGAVTHMEDDVWSFQGKDLYTLSTRRPLDSNVDHILEVQIVKRAFEGAPPAGSTRSVKAAVNDVINLNVTTDVINQAKKGPFTSFLHRLDTSARFVSVSQYARTSCPDLVDRGVWARIEKSVVEAHDRIATRLESQPALTGFVDELSSIIEKMKLE